MKFGVYINIVKQESHVVTGITGVVASFQWLNLKVKSHGSLFVQTMAKTLEQLSQTSLLAKVKKIDWAKPDP